MESLRIRPSEERADETPPPKRRRGILRFGKGRWWRVLYLGVLAYVGLFLLAQLVIFGGVITGRLLGKDPRENDPNLPTVAHLRSLDDRVWVGGQPTQAEYRDLVDQLDIEVVVNLRTGVGSDPIGDEEDFLAELGIEYFWLPIHDGHAPDPEEVDGFLEIVDNSTGQIYVHCGGGVGRSSALESAYLAVRGRPPQLLQELAVGPMSIEQMWYVFAAESAAPEGNNRYVEILSRTIDFPRPAFSWLRRNVFE